MFVHFKQMFPKCFHFPILTVIFLVIQGAAAFFVKHVQTGMCINDTSIIQSQDSKGNLSYVELSNNCLDPAAQFKFRDNGAMLNLKRQGCLAAFFRYGSGYRIFMFYIYVGAVSLDTNACAEKPDEKIYRAITQTSWGGLSVYYRRNYKDSFQPWCAHSGSNRELAGEQGIDPYVGFTKSCTDAPNKRFRFGSVTCYGKMTKNANCPKDQYMVVKTASYRGLSTTTTCGLNDGYSCEVNVTCLVKKQCDGQHECSITVDDKLFPADSCQGFTRYLYFEYQCAYRAPSGPPLYMQVTAKSSSSLSVTWKEPEEHKRNGIIVNYTVCISHEESKPCFEEITKEENMLVIGSLNASTKYYVRVLASNKAGRGNYSDSKGKITNGKQPQVGAKQTKNTLSFSLQIPSGDFQYYYVVALKLKDGKKPTSSPDSYENNELVTYEARESNNPKPYIAAVITSKNENMFILGDGRNTSNTTSRRRRSTSSDYYNGPLESNTSYSIFQRIFINEEGEYYSTDWSASLSTNEYTGGPHVLTNLSSGDIKAKEGDLVTLLCSAQGEPLITFSWEKDGKPLESLVEINNPHRSSLLVVTMKDETSFGKYTCYIRDRFQSTTHTIWIEISGKEKSDDGSEKYLAGFIVVIIFLIISFLIIAYLIYQNRRLKTIKENSENKSKDKNNFKDIYENPDKVKEDANYEQVEDEQSTYTALKRTGKEDDDHLYGHLNNVNNDYVNEETGI